MALSTIPQDPKYTLLILHVILRLAYMINLLLLIHQAKLSKGKSA